jgi:hypothetical protein
LQVVAVDQEVDAGEALATGEAIGAQRHVLHAGDELGGEVGGDLQGGDVLEVLVVVVVPFAGGQADLAGAGDDGVLVAVAEDGELDLAGVDGSLDEELAVVAGGELEGADQLVLVAGLADADGAALVGGLDEAGEAEAGVHVVDDLVALVQGAEVGGVELDPRDDGDGGSWWCRTCLKRGLVHAQGGGEHAAADVGQAEDLEQALEGAVLAVRAVQDREHEVGAEGEEVAHGLAVADDAGERGVDRSGAPAAVAADAEQDRCEAIAVERGEHLGRAAQRDLVLRAAAAEDEEEALGWHGWHEATNAARAWRLPTAGGPGAGRGASGARGRRGPGRGGGGPGGRRR